MERSGTYFVLGLLLAGVLLVGPQLLGFIHTVHALAPALATQ